MSDSPTRLTPSVEEFAGWYNIRGDYGDGHPVLRSVEPVPAFEHAEFFNLYPRAAEWFDELVTPRPNVPFDPLVEPPFFVRSDADDRTLDVDADFSYLDVPLLQRIQREFLGRHPLWRVILIAEHPSLSIVVYPTAIRFGNRPVGVDPEKALRQILPAELALRERRQRNARRHISHLQGLLPAAVRAIDNRPFLVCGVLDSYEGDRSQLTICLLIKGPDSNAIQIENPPGSPDAFACSSAFGVGADGTIISSIAIPETTPFSLARWLIPADYRGELILIERVTEQRHLHEVRSENIIRSTS